MVIYTLRLNRIHNNIKIPNFLSKNTQIPKLKTFEDVFSMGLV